MMHRDAGHNPAWEMSPAEVAAAVKRGEVVLVDCRESKELAAASIAGAVHIPLGEIAARADEVDALGGGRIVVFCHGGVRSLKAAAALRAAGVDRAWSMAGGIDRWSREIDPGVPRY